MSAEATDLLPTKEIRADFSLPTSNSGGNLYGNNCGRMVPLGPKLLHYITLLFRIKFPDYEIIVYIAELVSNYFLGYAISCIVTEHTMWASNYIT